MTQLPILPEFDPAPHRSGPPFIASEHAMLESWLDFHRAALLAKCEGLDDEQLRMRSVRPSALSLHGLVRHMTEVERNWFRRVLLDEEVAHLYCTDGNEDGDFDDVDAADVSADFVRFRQEVEHCRRISAEHTDLDAVGTGQRHGNYVSLRWIYVHMIEEYAQHNGHADLLRERIDGVTAI